MHTLEVIIYLKNNLFISMKSSLKFNVLCFFPAGTLWNLSSNEALFKTLIERALTALTDEILVLHSGVKQSSAGAEEGKEKGTSPYPEWEKVLINTTGFLRYGQVESYS